ncbi:PAAR motif family protein, partial [Yersinia pestis PY-32]
MAPLLV